MNKPITMGMCLLFGIIIVMKTLLCKGISIGIFLILFWVKGKKLQFNSDKWDDFFLQMPTKTVQRYAVTIYLAATVSSTIISYFILEWVECQYSLGIAALLLAGGLVITAYRWHTKGKDYLLKRYREIPETILERRKREETAE